MFTVVVPSWEGDEMFFSMLCLMRPESMWYALEFPVKR